MIILGMERIPIIFSGWKIVVIRPLRACVLLEESWKPIPRIIVLICFVCSRIIAGIGIRIKIISRMLLLVMSCRLRLITGQRARNGDIIKTGEWLSPNWKERIILLIRTISVGWWRIDRSIPSRWLTRCQLILRWRIAIKIVIFLTWIPVRIGLMHSEAAVTRSYCPCGRFPDVGIWRMIS